MKSKKVISRKNLPINIPVISTIVAALACDHWNLPSWACGAIGCLFILFWAVAIHSILFVEDQEDIFDK